MNVDIDKLEELAKAADPECAWPFYEAAFRKQVTPATLLALIAELRQAREAKAVGAVPEGVNNLRKALQEILSQMEGHPEFMPWVETEKELDDIGGDAAFVTYNAKLARDALASSPVLPEQEEQVWIAFCDQYEGRKLTGEMREALDFGLNWNRRELSTPPAAKEQEKQNA